MFVLRSSDYAPGLRLARHAHDYSNITIVLAGKIEETTERGAYCAHAGSVVSKGAGCEHENRVGGFGARTLTIQFGDDSPVRPHTWSWFDSPQVVRRAVAVQRASGGDALESALFALVEEVTSATSPAFPPGWVAEMVRALDEGFDQSIRFDHLARDFGLHPVYVARAFRRHVGMSMSEYVRALRIRHARHALSASRRTVAAIAAECGFADASHLCRTFTDALGTTPSAYRRLTRMVH
jgi:AraC family transcriptional regulator